MNARIHTAALCAAFLACSLATGDADARERRHGHHGWHDRWENRRDAQRASVVVGAIASGVARSSAYNRAERRYEECLQGSAYQGYDARYPNAYGYGPTYPWCAQMRYQEEQRACRSGRRAGAIAGSIAYSVVRD